MRESIHVIIARCYDSSHVVAAYERASAAKLWASICDHVVMEEDFRHWHDYLRKAKNERTKQQILDILQHAKNHGNDGLANFRHSVQEIPFIDVQA